MPNIQPFEKHAEEYDAWFTTYKNVFNSELKAIRKAMPAGRNFIEVGLGSGIFASALGINEGIEPSDRMRERAIKLGIYAFKGVAEALPYANNSQTGVLMVTTICFVDDIYKTFHEAYRVLKLNGNLVIGFVDKDSQMGMLYQKNKTKDVFYKDATFYNTEEVIKIIQTVGFKTVNIYQTVFDSIDKVDQVQEPMNGYGKGSFVVLKAKKNK